MTSTGAEDHPAGPAAPTPPTTGVGEVDRALGRLDGVEARPLAERVAVFEATHAALRRALDPSDADPSGGTGGTAGPGAQPGPA